MGVSQFEEAPAGSHRPKPPAKLGLVVGLVDQPGLEEHASWSGRRGQTDYVDVAYKVAGGPELGRYLPGEVRTHLHPVDDTWAEVERLATEHLRDVSTRTYEPVSRVEPAWENIRVGLGRSPIWARYAIPDGFEAIAFPLGDRVVSSVFSVFDASGTTTAFKVLVPQLAAE